MNLKSKIFLLEDDLILNETIAEYLEENGYETIVSFDGSDALEKIYENSFDLLLLDVNVPKINGYEILKTLRQKGDNTPAVFITSLNGVGDLARGFEVGCDDYVRKPFELKELLIRINSILKRKFYHKNSDKIAITDKIFFDILGNNLEKEGLKVELNQKELKLLKLFLQNKNRLISHDEIYAKLWDFDENPSETALRTYIKNLRKIIGKDKIVSLKKLGYKFID